MYQVTLHHVTLNFIRCVKGRVQEKCVLLSFSNILEEVESNHFGTILQFLIFFLSASRVVNHFDVTALLHSSCFLLPCLGFSLLLPNLPKEKCWLSKVPCHPWPCHQHGPHTLFKRHPPGNENGNPRKGAK
jgi:hypothetical protein